MLSDNQFYTFTQEELKVISQRVKKKLDEKFQGNQSELARVSGISRTEINTMLNGYYLKKGNSEKQFHNPKPETLLKLCKAFDCEMDYFLGKIEHSTHDLQYICDQTGLEEKTVRKLMRMKKSKQLKDVSYLAHLNGMIVNSSIIQNVIDYKGCSESESLGFRNIEYQEVKPDTNGNLIDGEQMTKSIRPLFKVDGMEIPRNLFTEAILRQIEEEIKKLEPIMPSLNVGTLNPADMKLPYSVRRM